MDKRLLIVLPICMLIMVGWSFLFPPPRPPATPQTAVSTPAVAAQDEPSSAAASGAAPATPATIGPRVVDTVAREQVVTVGRPGEPGHYRAVFTNRGAGLVELATGNYVESATLEDDERDDPEHWVRLLGGGRSTSMVLRASDSARDIAGGALESELWTMRTLGPESAPTGVEFELSPGTGVTFKKRFLFVPGTYEMRFELELRNDALAGAGGTTATTGPSGARQFLLTPVGWMHADSGDQWYPEPRALAAGEVRGGVVPQPAIVPVDPEGQDDPRGPLAAQPPLGYAGVVSKYFAVLLHPADETARATLIGAGYRRLRDDAWAAAHPVEADAAWRQVVTDVDLQTVLPPVGESRTWAYRVYAGPKDRDLLESVAPGLGAVVTEDLDVWFFGSGISALMLYVLRFFESVTGNWGVAIILLTFSVRLILFPINRRSQTAMSRYQAKMKRLQPKIDELKKKHEKDPSKLRQEQAQMMQKEGAFPPLGGCLPMFLQIPVFIGLYRALGVSFDLRQAPFWWIDDLSLPDRLLRIGLDTHLPFVGTIEYLNILPPIMVALMVWQQKGMPMPADEQAARMQKMMLWMPVMMGFFLYNYAAGLSLYMITQSGLGVFEQKVIRKYWPVDDKELPQKKSGFLAKVLAAQEQQMKKIQAQQTASRRAKR